MATETTNTAPVGQKLLRKLTLRTFIGSKADILGYALTGREREKDTTGDPVPLLQVIGQCTGYKAGQSDYGDFIELRGNFMATNLQTGELMENCSRAILPNVVGDSIAEALKAGAEAANFAVEIDAAYDEAAAVSYVFSVRTLIRTQVAQPVQGILAALQSQGIAMTKPKMLAAPKAPDEALAKQAAGEKAANTERDEKAKKPAKV